MTVEELSQKHQREINALFLSHQRGTISEEFFNERLKALQEKHETEDEEHGNALLKEAEEQLDAQLKSFYKEMGLQPPSKL